jgi:hypothetical protein
MGDVLGLSIGMANLVAARADGTTVTRQSVLTLYPGRPPEVGVPTENPQATEPGLMLRRFIPGSGEPDPLVASDGSIHHRDTVTAEALDAMARTAGYGTSTVVAVPGHWGQNAVTTLREALLRKPSLTAGGIPPTLVSDATAALASLYAQPGFPTDGVVVLCDFGASGTSVTLSDAAANFRHLGETMRYPDFAGDRVDEAILRHLQAAFTATDCDIANTVPPGLLSRRLDKCRLAKERLSSATVAVLPAEMPVISQEVRLSRVELEAMISEPLDQLVSNVEQLLRHNTIPTGKLAAVATVGGGACMPLVTERLAQRLHAPVVTTPQPILSAATGAAAFAEQQVSAGVPTDTAVAAPATAGTPAPTAIDPSAWAVGAAMVAAGESVADGVESATQRALAWSEDDAGGDDVPPLVADEGADPALASAPAPVPPAPAATQSAPVPQRRRRRLGVWLGATAMAILVTLLAAGLMTSKLLNTHAPTPATSRLPLPKPLPKVSPLRPPPVTVTSTSVETTVITPTRVPTTVITTSIAPTTTTRQPTRTWETTTQPTTTATYPSPYPSYSPVTTTPPTTVLRPPRLVPVTPPYSP